MRSLSSMQAGPVIGLAAVRDARMKIAASFMVVFQGTDVAWALKSGSGCSALYTWLNAADELPAECTDFPDQSEIVGALRARDTQSRPGTGLQDYGEDSFTSR